MEIFIIIIALIVAILNIILFFKIWGATNDIDKITKHFTDKENKNSTLFLFLNKDYDTIYNNLNIEFFDKLRYATIFEIKTEKGFIERKEYLLKTYKEYYTAIGKEIPEKFYTVTFRQMYNINSLKEVFELNIPKEA